MSRPRALVTALLAALVTVLAGPAGPLPTVAAEPVAPVDASDQGGDPYFPFDGNAGYDVGSYDIDLTVTPRNGRLRGSATVQARAEATLRSFSLDLALTPDWVRVDGRKAAYRKPRAHELRVIPATPVIAGSDFSVSVGYRGTPSRVKATGVKPFLWAPGEAMAIGEPQIGPWWFPANETPRDKASFDVSLRVPHGSQAVSNGRLVKKAVGKKWTTWRWQQARPITTYLSFFAAGRFDIRSSVVDGRPTTYAVSRKLTKGERDQSFRLLERTPGLTRWLEDWLGPYPYDTNGGVISGLWAGFALENAGRPTYPFVGGPGDRYNVLLLVHELAHQWFGDDVSVQRWRDIWLNEGLATYAEWAYAEATWGDGVPERLRDEYDWRTGSFWKLSLSDPGAERVFGEPVYERGAMAVAALRCRIGESDLDELLTRWLSDHAGGNATVEDFRALASEVSGQDLDPFFDAWLDATAKPADTADNGLDCA